jgi:hypothetical protein
MFNLIKWFLVTLLAAAGIFLVGADTRDLTIFVVSKLIGVLLIGVAWFASLVKVEDK